MLPDIWGKYGWNFIHLITLDYPQHPTDSDKTNYRNFFYALIYVLPCAKCKHNLAKNISNFPLTDNILSNRSSFVKWGIQIHNIVNNHLGKPVLSYKEALYEIKKLANPKKEDNTITYIIALVAIIFMIFMIKTLWK